MICPAFSFYMLPSAIQIIVTIFFIPPCIIAAFGNTFCLIVLWQPSQRSKSNKILTSLALSDCLVGYVSLPWTVWLINFDQDGDKTFCHIIKGYFLTGLWFITCSTCTILFIAYERYVSITKHAQYHDILTDQKINIIIGLIWSITLIFGISSNFYPVVYIFGGQLLIIVSVIILCCSYYFVWKAFRQSGKLLSRETNTPNQVAERKRHEQEQKLVNKVLILIAFYLAAFVPSLFFQGLLLVQGSMPSAVSVEALQYTNLFVAYAALSNSCFNPFIYVWKDAGFRLACKRLLRRRAVFAPSRTVNQTNQISSL
ncbi:histamine H2 receptor-like [Clytia hemisphaerica]|uniref:histamine H2 receptor-like n=1 Tax=Clytia hemisphaerica TaxID=252671 RepID=UPI0034D4CAA0